MPGRHPDDDQLADLAADVLPLDQARAVEAHVLACDRCASLLSDAERVRGLLLADDAGPVPPEIWSRIEAALQAASQASPMSSTSPVSSSPVRGEAVPPGPPPPTAPVDRPVDTPGRGSWDGPDPLDDPDDWTTAARPVVASESRSRPGSPTGSVRRISTSRRDTRSERRRGPASLLLVAAAAVVLVLAVGAVRLVRSGSDATAALTGRGGSESASSASAAAGAAATGVALTRSNKEYTSSTLAAGARALVASARSPKGAVAAQGRSTGDAVDPAAPRATESLTSVSPDTGAPDVTNPQRLAACVTALGASPDSVVAVDLARFKGREAAVIIVHTASGYEVWVVERTCHPGDEGALAQTTLAG